MMQTCLGWPGMQPVYINPSHDEEEAAGEHSASLEADQEGPGPACD